MRLNSQGKAVGWCQNGDLNPGLSQGAVNELASANSPYCPESKSGTPSFRKPSRISPAYVDVHPYPSLVGVTLSLLSHELNPCSQTAYSLVSV